MSFSLTEAQFLARTKTVTRRMAWLSLKAGDHLLGIRKGMGLKKGEKQVVLGEIVVVDVRREPLCNIALEDDACAKEGFPDMGADEFTRFFCKHNKRITSVDEVTRIEFRYVEDE